MEKEIIKKADSKNSLKTYSMTKDNATVMPDFSFDLVQELISKEPVAKGAIKQFISKFMEGDHNIVDKKTMLYKKDEELRLEEKYGFKTNVLRKVALMGKFFNNAFIEIVDIEHINSDGTSQNKIKALNVLDSSAVEAITKPNGDLIKLKSKHSNPDTGEYAVWDASEIVWIKFEDMSQGYAPVDLKSLYETLLIKSWVRRYIGWLWKTGQYRVLYNPKTASDGDIEDFVAYLERNDDDYQVPFIFKGDLETKMIRDIKEIESINTYLSYLDSQILILLRVPPVDAGITDASGRSSADQQSNNLITSVTDMKKVIENSISFDLFPKINKGKLLLKFGPADRFAVKQVLEMVQIMKSINMTDVVCKDFFNDMGMFFAEDKLFDEPIELDPIKAAGANPRDKDQAPSRKGKGAGEGNKAKESVSTRPDQLAKQ